LIDYTLLTLAIALLAVTVLGKVRLHDWWIRACEFPRVQIVSLAVLVAVAALWLENDGLQKWVLAILAAVLALQLYRILPWTRLWPLQVQSAEPGQEDRCVTLMIANVLTPNRNSQGLIRQVQEHRPDVLLTLESISGGAISWMRLLVTGRPLSACRWTTSMACICIRGCRWTRLR